MRELLARIIGGADGAAPVIDPDCADELLSVARAEGVGALVNHCLANRVDVADAVRDAFANAARAQAAAHLRWLAETRRVVDALDSAGIPLLILKGCALGHWLYAEAYLRESSDIDLLFNSRADAERAALALAPMGYSQLYSPHDMAHEFACRRVSSGVQVDLDMHWRLAEMPLLREIFSFGELFAASIPLSKLNEHARGLDPIHAFMHACIHRASNVCAGLGDRLKWLFDLHLLAGCLSDAEWNQLLGLCMERGLCGICAEGLGASAALFATVIPAHVRDALEAGRVRESFDASRLSDWKYMQRCNLAALPSLRERVRWLWQRSFPPRGYLRELYGTDVGVFGLFAQRLKRALGRLRG